LLLGFEVGMTMALVRDAVVSRGQEDAARSAGAVTSMWLGLEPTISEDFS